MKADQTRPVLEDFLFIETVSFKSIIRDILRYGVFTIFTQTF